MQIAILFSLMKKTYYLDVEPNDTIYTAKCKLQDQSGIPPSQQRLLYAGKEMENGKTLSYYKIEKQYDIYLVVRLRGGGFQFNSCQNKIQQELTSQGPDYRTISDGLILHAICQTDSCEAFDKQVCVQKGFGTFNIEKEIYNCICPACKKPTRQAKNLAYYQTHIIIKGQQKDGKLINREDTASNGKLAKFRGNDEDIRSWNYLQITAKPLK